jgi:purine-binding chemotaxis protein CheW
VLALADGTFGRDEALTMESQRNLYMPSATLEPATAAVHDLAGKYLTFALHHESYGIDVLKVREIIRLTSITTVPQMPAYVRGVINLRGKIIPVMDLRLRFGFAGTPDTEQTCIIVVQAKLPDGKSTQMGLVVDGVEEVTNIAEADLEETPDFGAQICTDYIVGMAKVKGAVKTLLDIDGVISAEASRNKSLAASSPTLAVTK